MKKASIIANAVVCLALFLVTWGLMPRYFHRFYQFDTNGIFLVAYFPLLFVIGVVMKMAERGVPWKRSFRGSVAGVIAGVAAQLLVMAVESYRFDGVASLLGGQWILSLVIMSFVLLTPLWGMLAAHGAAALERSLRQPH